MQYITFYWRANCTHTTVGMLRHIMVSSAPCQSLDISSPLNIVIETYYSDCQKSISENWSFVQNAVPTSYILEDKG